MRCIGEIFICSDGGFALLSASVGKRPARQLDIMISWGRYAELRPDRMDYQVDFHFSNLKMEKRNPFSLSIFGNIVLYIRFQNYSESPRIGIYYARCLNQTHYNLCYKSYGAL